MEVDNGKKLCNNSTMPKLSEEKNSLFIRCSCHYHVLEVANDDWGIEDGSIPTFDISVWNQSPVPFTFWQRLKLIWTLIWGGKLDGGDVILQPEDAKEVADFLNQKLTENKAKLEEYAKTKQTKKG